MVSKREISCGGGSSLWKITMSKNGKSTISMGHGFNSYVTKYQRVYFTVILDTRIHKA
jgi:hypothetical protein